MPEPTRFVVVGDSCAEGLDDRYPDSETYRGWGDLVAGALARRHPGLRYANLAVRGKRLDQVVADQLPRAAELRPDVVALFAGVNDLLRRDVRPAVIHQRVDDAVGRLAAIAPTVVLFTVGDVSRQTPLLRALRPRLATLNAAVRRAAVEHGARLVDLETLEPVRDLRLFGPDRFHLSPAGHRRVAAHVLAALGVTADAAWLEPLPGDPVTATWRSHAGWLREQAAPVLVSRVRNLLTGRSTGDGFVPKRPELQPVPVSGVLVLRSRSHPAVAASPPGSPAAAPAPGRPARRRARPPPRRAGRRRRSAPPAPVAAPAS